MRSIANEIQLGAALRERRERAGLTQGHLAERAGVSRAFLIDLERGRRPRAELGRVLSVMRALDAAITLVDAERRDAEDALADLLGDL
ncbi:helix-turn-helix transcriptional regulator [Cellulosimicrobium cellulans]|uniref:helix-turn-helix transcriptional regulator n=1 Tax=Cellulosimicrobium cellulans TaxID=1710 RepID=UPI0020CD0D3C|nr:helix-turn-helix domain-containing protein [Cellulosimicrobium cellulans]